MKTTSCSPLGVKLQGKTYEVDAEEGRQLVDGKFAEVVEAEAVPVVEAKEKPSKKTKAQPATELVEEKTSEEKEK